MYINDICEAVSNLNVTLKLFADDAKIYSVLDYDIAIDLSAVCNRITTRGNTWQMRLALNKCHTLRI